MHTTHQLSPAVVFLAELAAGAGGATNAHSIPPLVAGFLSAICAGALLRLADPTLRGWGEDLNAWIRRRRR